MQEMEIATGGKEKHDAGGSNKDLWELQMGKLIHIP